jgi:hypothetical protein
MSTAIMRRFTESPPRFKARIAGLLFPLVLLTAIFNEFIVHGRLGSAANLAGDVLEVSGMVAVTLLFYLIFSPVNRSFALLAVAFNLVGFPLEALQWQPHGVGIGMVFHACYCLLISYLIFKSAFLSPIVGGLMAFAGLGWLTFLSMPLANYLSPYNLIPGMFGEVSVSLWLLVMGVNDQRWHEQAAAAATIRA